MEWWEILLTTGIISALVSISTGLWRDRNLEGFKSELRKEIIEHETKFISHHDKRAEVISQIHTRIAVAEQRIRQAGLPIVPAPFIEGQGTSPPYDPVHDAFMARQQLESYFNENSLYLTEHQTELVSGMLEQLHTAWINAYGFRSTSREPEAIKESRQSHDDALEIFGELKDSLVASFRETLEVRADT